MPLDLNSITFVLFSLKFRKFSAIYPLMSIRQSKRGWTEHARLCFNGKQLDSCPHNNERKYHVSENAKWQQIRRGKKEKSENGALR